MRILVATARLITDLAMWCGYGATKGHGRPSTTHDVIPKDGAGKQARLRSPSQLAALASAIQPLDALGEARRQASGLLYKPAYTVCHAFLNGWLISATLPSEDRMHATR